MLLPSLKFVGDTLSVSALIGLVTLTFNLLTSNLVRVIAHKVGNLLNNFDVLGTFRSRFLGLSVLELGRQTDTATIL